MLRGIRNASSNWIGKAVLSTVMGVLIVSFGVWGIADVFKGFGSSTLAKIGSTEITTEQFRNLYTDKLQQLGRQFGRPLTMEQARGFGLDRQMLQQVIAESTLDEEARRMGLAQSDAEVVKAIAADPNFKGLTGQFDQERFAQTIRQFGYTEKRYVAEQRKVSLRRQLAGTVTAGVEPSKTQMDALARFQGEERTLDYVRLTSAQAGTIEAPSPEALASYFEERKNVFRAPEFRKIAFLALSPDQLAKKQTISDDDARKIFEQQKDRFATPEKRQVSQIPFPNETDAKTARDKIAAGTSFDDLAKERGLTPADTSLGLVTKSAVGDAAIADAAFALPLNDVSQPVKGALTTALVRVSKIEAGVTPSFETSAPAIKNAIALDRSRNELRDLRNKIEDERAGGSNIVDASKKLGLEATVIEAIDRSGRGADGKPVTALPQGADVITPAFASDVGVENEAVQANGGDIWFDVLAITPSRERTLDEVKDQVEARWRDDQIAERLRIKATAMIEKLKQGGKFVEVAAAENVKVEKTAAFKRDATLNGLPDRLADLAFRTAKDEVASTGGSSGPDLVVFRVTDIVIPQANIGDADAQKLKDILARAMNDEQLAQYVAGLEKQIGVTINQSAFATATGVTSNQ